VSWYLLSVSLHILAACVWIGGMVFLAAALLPVLRQPPYRGVALPLLHATSMRFRWLGWGALGTLIVTGVANLLYRGQGWDQWRTGALWHEWFGRVLALKLVLIAIIVAVSAVHDLWIGPRVTLGGATGLSPAHLQRLRRRAAWVGRVVLLLSLAVVVLGVMLVRGIP